MPEGRPVQARGPHVLVAWSSVNEGGGVAACSSPASRAEASWRWPPAMGALNSGSWSCELPLVVAVVHRGVAGTACASAVSCNNSCALGREGPGQKVVFRSPVVSRPCGGSPARRAGRSLEARLLGAAVAVVEVGGDADHAVQAGVVCRGHLRGRGAAHAPHGLDGHGRGDVHAGAIRGRREIRVRGRVGGGAAVVDVGGSGRHCECGCHLW